MGCERIAQFEALTDYLLALRALLEPEGSASGRLAGRLAVILCAGRRARSAGAARRLRHLPGACGDHRHRSGDRSGCSADGLVDEMAEHLRAILRDALCGHLDADVRSVADELLAEAARRPPELAGLIRSGGTAPDRWGSGLPPARHPASLNRAAPEGGFNWLSQR